MRHRHEVVEIGSDPGTGAPGPADGRVVWRDDDTDGELLLIDEPLLIDETAAPRPVLGERIGATPAADVSRHARSAVPRSSPMSQSRPVLPWGLGTDGWPRHNSRLVRLFACDPSDLLHGVAGRSWGPMQLSLEVRSPDDGRWPGVIIGTLQMPYPSRPLDVEIRIEPFHDRYSRVDVVLCSHRRWPRRYFDVASQCLTRMQRLERPWGGGPKSTAAAPATA